MSTCKGMSSRGEASVVDTTSRSGFDADDDGDHSGGGDGTRGREGFVYAARAG